jgi:probable H4MPT-linked C1 transfer pathway protein
MPRDLTTGWDLGGAHLKAAQVEPGGRLVTALQIPCRLWLGIDEFAQALGEARQRLQPSRRHGVTMTGELADLFADRAEGVRQLSRAMTRAFPKDDIRFYAGDGGFVVAADDWQAIASANWHASARFVAARQESALFMDVGSTTTDIVPICGGRIDAVGYTDDERLASEELIYTGATRTPVMVVADSVPFGGGRQRLMAEFFSTMADVHRLTGELPEDADQLPAADGRGKSAEDSARRLARMLGRDLQSASPEDWRRLAVHLAERQRQTLHAAVDRVLSRGGLDDSAPLVGAGIGRFLARALAERLCRPYVDFADLVQGEASTREWAARCAPAAAVAILAADPR